MPLTLFTAPTAEPITLDEAKLQVQQTGTFDDDYLDTIAIPWARGRAESATNRALMTQTWELVIDQFPGDGYIELPHPPLQSVTHLKYRDTAGSLQTWASANYIVQAPAGPKSARGRVSLAYGIAWPSTYGQMGDITIRFVCGYGDEPHEVPPLLRGGILLDLATIYAQRENAEIPGWSKKIYGSFYSPQSQMVGW